jgi:head-tail adaptor
MAVRAGKLRQRIKIQSRTDTETGTAGMDIAYADVATVSADVTNSVGKQIVDDRGQSFAVTHLVEIRSRASLTKKNVILYPVTNGIRYQIASIQDLDELGRRQLLQLYPVAEESTLIDPSPGTLPNFP